MTHHFRKGGVSRSKRHKNVPESCSWCKQKAYPLRFYNGTSLVPRLPSLSAAPCLVTQRFFFKMADSKVKQPRSQLPSARQSPQRMGLDEWMALGTRLKVKTKVTAPPTVPTKRAEEVSGDEATTVREPSGLLSMSADLLLFEVA